jgi:hypothetical protein
VGELLCTCPNPDIVFPITLSNKTPQAHAPPPPVDLICKCNKAPHNSRQQSPTCCWELHAAKSSRWHLVCADKVGELPGLAASLCWQQSLRVLFKVSCAAKHCFREAPTNWGLRIAINSSEDPLQIAANSEETLGDPWGGPCKLQGNPWDP